jgi:hypothetical protein
MTTLVMRRPRPAGYQGATGGPDRPDAIIGRDFD